MPANPLASLFPPLARPMSEGLHQRLAVVLADIRRLEEERDSLITALFAALATPSSQGPAASRGPTSSTGGTGGYPALPRHHRLYVVWPNGPVPPGLYHGPHPEVWDHILEWLPNRSYSGSGQRLRRCSSWAEAYALWGSGGQRTLTDRPVVHEIPAGGPPSPRGS